MKMQDEQHSKRPENKSALLVSTEVEKKQLQICLNTEKEEEVYITLLNSFGQCVFTQKCRFSSARPYMVFKLTTFPAGLYFVSILRKGNIIRRYLQLT